LALRPTLSNEEKRFDLTMSETPSPAPQFVLSKSYAFAALFSSSTEIPIMIAVQGSPTKSPFLAKMINAELPVALLHAGVPSSALPIFSSTVHKVGFPDSMDPPRL